MTTAFKLVRHVNNQLISACPVLEEFTTIYEVGKWAHPSQNKTKLFVFSEIQFVNPFIRARLHNASRDYTFRLFECECRNLEVVKTMGIVDNVKSFWKYWKEHTALSYDQKIEMLMRSWTSTNSIPEGAMWCDTLKLTVEIKSWKPFHAKAKRTFW